MKRILAALALVAALSNDYAVAGAQAPPAAKPETTKPEATKSALTPLRLSITVSRYQGDKKISSLPYSLSTSAGGPPLRFNIGAQVPYAVSAADDKAKTPAYSYRNVGISIIVSNQLVLDTGQYKFDINVEDNSLASTSQIQGAPAIPGVPIFRTFNTSGIVILRDGQTTQLTTAGEPITGETLRVDVMLTVVK